MHQRFRGAVEVRLVDLELDLVAAALLVGDAGEQVELLPDELPGRERVEELALLLDDPEREGASVLRQHLDHGRGVRQDAEGEREHLVARELGHGGSPTSIGRRAGILKGVSGKVRSWQT